MQNRQALEPFLADYYYCNCQHPAVIDFTIKHTKDATSIKEKVIKLYEGVRDGFRYYPYHLILKPEALKASYLLTKDYGYCVEKSNLFAAGLRILGIPSRLCFSNVRNHLATEKMEQYLRTDLMVFHGYVELFLDEKWIKATPVFDKATCERLGVAVLDFDAEHDSIFQESDKSGNPFMSYEHHYGHFEDVPFDLFLSELRKNYPHIFENKIFTDRITIDF